MLAFRWHTHRLYGASAELNISPLSYVFSLFFIFLASARPFILATMGWREPKKTGFPNWQLEEIRFDFKEKLWLVLIGLRGALGSKPNGGSVIRHKVSSVVASWFQQMLDLRILHTLCSFLGGNFASWRRHVKIKLLHIIRQSQQRPLASQYDENLFSRVFRWKITFCIVALHDTFCAAVK